MKRMQIGLIALVCLLSALALYVLYVMGSAAAGGMYNTVGILARVGFVLGALWLAMPQLTSFFTKTPKWLLIALVCAGVVFLIRPWLFWWIPVAMIGMWLFYSRFNIFQRGGSAGSGSGAPVRAPRRPKRKA